MGVGRNLLFIFFCFSIQYSFSQTSLLKGTWEGMGGKLVLHFEDDSTGHLLIINSPKEISFKLVKNKIIILGESIDTFPILHLTYDTLILNIGKPLLPQTTYRFVHYREPKEKLTKLEIDSFLRNHKFLTKTPYLGTADTVHFKADGSHIWNNKVDTWKISEFNDYIFLIISSSLHGTSYSKVTHLTASEIDFSVYEEFDDYYYKLKLRRVQE